MLIKQTFIDSSLNSSRESCNIDLLQLSVSTGRDTLGHFTDRSHNPNNLNQSNFTTSQVQPSHAHSTSVERYRAFTRKEKNRKPRTYNEPECVYIL